MRLCIRSGIDPCRRSHCRAGGRSVGSQPITTIEGLASGEELHPIQQAWIDEDVASCGYCQPGQIMTRARADRGEPEPDRRRHRRGDENNVCRCGTYVRIRAAIKAAAARDERGGAERESDREVGRRIDVARDARVGHRHAHDLARIAAQQAASAQVALERAQRGEVARGPEHGVAAPPAAHGHADRAVRARERGDQRVEIRRGDPGHVAEADQRAVDRRVERFRGRGAASC